MYEHRRQPPISFAEFRIRFARHMFYALLAMLVPLIVGMIGYHAIASFTWVDSFLNTCMLLGGMGPVGDLPNAPAKIFAGVFALFAGLIYIGLGAFILAPVFHRVLHRFHWEAENHERETRESK